MASKNKKSTLLVMVAALAVAFLPALAAAAEHTVGDGAGWTLGFDYAAWAATKQFKVGDTIVFRYSNPRHTVVEVGGADFAACTKPADAAVMRSGEDRVTLDAAGRRWFVCSVGKHCQNGMKLKITVADADEEGAGAAPAPAPWSSFTAPSPAFNPADIEGGGRGDLDVLAPGSPSTAPASSPAAGVNGHGPCFGRWRCGLGRRAGVLGLF